MASVNFEMSAEMEPIFRQALPAGYEIHVSKLYGLDGNGPLYKLRGPSIPATRFPVADIRISATGGLEIRVDECTYVPLQACPDRQQQQADLLERAVKAESIIRDFNASLAHVFGAGAGDNSPLENLSMLIASRQTNQQLYEEACRQRTADKQRWKLHADDQARIIQDRNARIAALKQELADAKQANPLPLGDTVLSRLREWERWKNIVEWMKLVAATPCNSGEANLWMKRHGLSPSWWANDIGALYDRYGSPQ